MLDGETAKVVQRRLKHENGEAGAFYASLPPGLAWGSKPPHQPIGSNACWPSAGMSCGGRRRADSRHEHTPAKARSAGRPALDGLAGIRSLSPYLDAFPSGARSAAVAAASRQAGANAYGRKKPAARSGPESRLVSAP
jgi:hypothetical protein